jgi:thioredoxin 1
MKLLTELNFESEIGQGNCWVMFWAAWCGPCINCEYLEDFEKINPSILVAKVNVEENSELAVQYYITTVPTYIFFKQGKPIKRLIGLQDKESLQKSTRL